jgi:hypothetical protein
MVWFALLPARAEVRFCQHHRRKNDGSCCAVEDTFLFELKFEFKFLVYG